MSAENESNTRDYRPEIESVFWEEKRGLITALLIVVATASVLLFTGLSSIGIWEPWEAQEIFVAQEYANRGPAPEIAKPTDPSYNWAVPTKDGKPIAHSLLKTWVLSKTVGQSSGEFEIGSMEFKARVPFAFALFLLTLAGFAWVRHYWGTKAGVMTSLAFVSFPAIYLGVHNLASEMLFVATTSAALLAVTHLVYATNRRVLWGAIVGLLQVLAFMDQRLVGLYSIMAVVSAWCVTEVAFEQAVRYREGRPGILSKHELRPALITVGLAVLVVLVGWWWNDPTEQKGLFEPHILQIYMAVVPILLFAAGMLLGRRTRVGRAVIGLPGIVCGIITFIGCMILGHAYGAANPTLLDGGEVVGKIPVLSYMLENHLFGRSLVDEHMTFDKWIRQIGFSLVPWVALVPLGIGYLARSTRNEDTVDIDSPQESLKRLMLVWAVFAGLVQVVAAAYDHFFYPAYFPLAAAVGLMLADRDFWKEARMRPLLAYSMGFLGCAIIMMVGKDLERFPTRFVEVYTTLEKGFELPEDFAFGKVWKGVKYATFLVMMVYFFGTFSWLVLTLRNIKTWPDRIRKWRASENRWQGLWEPTDRPYEARAGEKEALRSENSIVGKLALWLETPRYYAPFMVFWFAAIGLLFLYKWTPELTNHMSQRGVFQSYVDRKSGDEALYRYDVRTREASVYLSNVSEIENSRKFEEMFSSDDRFFAVIPRKNLARINYEVRKKTKKNIPVLDARSSRLLLISNALGEGDENKSFVAQHIFDEPPEITYETLFEEKATGEEKHPHFDDALEMIGFNLDHPKESDGYASYKWGETAVIDYYFRVKKRVPSSQKIFLHVDYPGNRINGDHYPNDGEFPTNYWLPGDIVRSRQNLQIDNYATPGVYTIYFGFFVGSNRMKVTPREAHDGVNRVPIGKFRVEPL